jgi:hypothetical protein
LGKLTTIKPEAAPIETMPTTTTASNRDATCSCEHQKATRSSKSWMVEQLLQLLLQKQLLAASETWWRMYVQHGVRGKYQSVWLRW